MRKKGYKKSVYQTLALISQLGISMIAPILLCTALGVWIQKKFGIAWPILPLLIMGILAGGRNVYALVRQTFDRPQEAEEEDDSL